MKALMKQVGGNGRGHKKARVWNMAQFQPRRWHREQAQTPAISPEPTRPSSTAPQPSLHESIDPSIQPVPLPFIHESTNPPIQPVAPAPAPPPPKEKDEIVKSFIALRSQGWSFRSISKKLGVPKSTLFNWESDTTNRRAIKVLKSIHVERLQEQHLPSFEDELVKLSTFLARIERALEKHDFESMRPEFLLRTSLQLRARLQKLRIDTHPTDTLDDADTPEINCGRIFRSEETFDDSDGNHDSDGSHARAASVVQDEPPDSEENWDTNENLQPSQSSPSATSADKVGTPVPLSNSLPSSKTAPETPSESSAEPVVNVSSGRCEPRVSAVNSETENWDTNKNSQLSQPSAAATSSDKVGTAVPLSQPQPELVVPVSAGPCSCSTSSPRGGCCSRAEHENRVARQTKQSHEAILSCV